MDWILDHLQILFVIAIAVASVIQKIRQSQSEASGTPERPAQQDPAAEAERTRQIQEEIRRRIAERRGEVVEEPEPEFEEEPQVFPGERQVEQTVPVVVAPPMLEESAELERQRELTERIRLLEQARASLAAQAAAPAARRALEAAAPAVNPWRVELGNPGGLRHAVVMREILGPPLGLR